MAIRVSSNKVYSQREPTSDELAAGIEYVKDGGLRAPGLVDASIESLAVRLKLEKDEANIAVTVLPGDRLGQFSVNVQLEGKSGEHEICLQEQDRLLQEFSAWLHEILGDFGCNFTVQLESLPCPHAEARLRVGRAAQVIQGREIEVESAGPAPRPKRTVNRTN